MLVQHLIGNKFGKIIGIPWDMCEGNDFKLSYEKVYSKEIMKGEWIEDMKHIVQLGYS